MEPENPRQDGVRQDVVHEADGSMWSSLWSNLRDALMPVKQPPLHLSSQPVDVTSVQTLIEEPIWKTLWNSVHDVFAPKKLPPLELTSTPIPVPDLLAVRRDPKSSALSFAAHAAVVALLILFALAQWHIREIQQKVAIVPLTPPIPAAPARLTMGGGGGGGNHEAVEASKGRLPRMAKVQLAPPQKLLIKDPKIAVEPTVVVPKPLKLADDPSMPNVGIPQSPSVTLSQGNGGGSGFGSGNGGGMGPGEGNGIGPGSGGNYGGGVMSVGGGVSGPILLYAPEPEFSDEARRAKYQGICVVGLIVDAQGRPREVQVVRPLGMGLDEKAVEAVEQYKFKPAMYKGHPVAVRVNVEVDFHIY